MEPRHAIDVSGSSCVEFVCYPQSQTLRLGFLGGESYDYLRVPPSVSADFATAESKAGSSMKSSSASNTRNSVSDDLPGYESST